MTADRPALEAALEKAAAQFRYYEKQHQQKTPPDTNKAEANRLMAAMCEDALLSAAKEGDRMREALEKMQARDNRNGSLPVWYRAMIDSVLTAGFVICDRCITSSACTAQRSCAALLPAGEKD